MTPMARMILDGPGWPGCLPNSSPKEGVSCRQRRTCRVSMWDLREVLAIPTSSGARARDPFVASTIDIIIVGRLDAAVACGARSTCACRRYQ